MPSQIDKFKDIILNVLKKHDVKRASLFGSIVKGEMNPDSDIDLVVEFHGKKSLLNLCGLKVELEEKLEHKVDVMTYNSLHPSLRELILAEMVDIL